MAANTDHLLPNELLGADQFLSSMNGRFTFIYQGDGNLVLYKSYRNRPRKWLWDSATNGRPCDACVMQGDGNLVIYGPGGEYIWDTSTDGQSGSRLVVQDDGNVVIYRPDGTPIWATNTVQQTVPSGPRAQGDDMQPGEVLNSDQFITSLNGRYTFVYQGDGNLVLYKNYRNRPRKWLWDSETNGRPDEVCILQADGNLVIYGPDGEYIWDTATAGQSGSRLVVQDDGNVVIYRPDGAPIWATNTVQRPLPSGPRAQGDDMQAGEVLNSDQSITSLNGRYTFVYQGDGNLVLYRNSDRRPLWASNTNGRPDEVCILQGDGNLVIYGPDGEYIWDTATAGQSGSRLVVQDDGDVVIYNARNQRVWSTDTVPPVVSSFAPITGEAGDSITIKGNNFVKVQRVLFGNSTARYTANSRTTITATVPDNPRSGQITIITTIGSATSITSFTAVATQPPIIDGFSPTKGTIGTGITLTGRNLSRVTAVQFNGINASFRIESGEKITTTVPLNASDGPITVTNRGGSVVSGSNFDVEVTIPPANLHHTNTWMLPNEWPSPNSPFTVYFAWFNGGGTATGKFTIRFQLDNGLAYRDFAIPSYAPGTGDYVWLNMPHGLPAGTYSMYCILDVFNQVAEVSEGDNINFHGFIVG